MAVAANPLVGDVPLASPELALVDAELAVELRRALSPVEDSWLRPPARVKAASAESEMDAPAQLESADDAGHAGSRDAERLHDDEVSASTPEQTPAEKPRPSPHHHYPALPAHETPAPWIAADLARGTEPRDAEQLLVDEYIVAVPEETPVQEQRSSHYPVLPAPEPARDAIEETDKALRRMRERLNESDESRPHRSRLRRWK